MMFVVARWLSVALPRVAMLHIAMVDNAERKEKERKYVHLEVQMIEGIHPS